MDAIWGDFIFDAENKYEHEYNAKLMDILPGLCSRVCCRIQCGSSYQSPPGEKTQPSFKENGRLRTKDDERHRREGRETHLRHHQFS